GSAAWRYCVEDTEHVGVGLHLRDAAERQRHVKAVLATTPDDHRIGHKRRFRRWRGSNRGSRDPGRHEDRDRDDVGGCHLFEDPEFLAGAQRTPAWTLVWWRPESSCSVC